jgi:hypothetical protein
MVARPSQERHKKKRTVLGKSTRNAGMDIYRQLETPLQKSIHMNGNDIRKWRKKFSHPNFVLATVISTYF